MSSPTSPIRVVTKAFLAASGRRALLVPEAYQQIRPQAHELPRQVEEDEVVGEHEGQHRRGEQGVGAKYQPYRGSPRMYWME